MIRIKTFEYGSSDAGDFQAFAARLYRDDPFAGQKAAEFPPPAYNPRFFLAEQDGEITGRACAMINPGIALRNRPTGLIGFYEAVDDLHTSQTLFEAIFSYFRDLKRELVIGPINGSTWNSYRLTLPGDENPFFLDNYHKPWYWRQFQASGFAETARYSSTKISELAGSYPRLDKFETYFQQKGIAIRPIDPHHFTEDLEKIYRISMDSFRDNFLYTPIEWTHFSEAYHKVQPYVDTELVLLAESKTGEPLGFIFAVPNLFEQRIKSLVIKTLAVVHKPEAKGLGVVMTEKIHQLAWRKGYNEAIHALMHETNQSNNILSDNSRPYRQYVLMEKEI